MLTNLWQQAKNVFVSRCYEAAQMIFGGKGKGFAISERRKGQRSLDQHRCKLKQFQIDRVSNLIQMGADLLFVRNAEADPLAVLAHEHQLLTVDQYGLIQSDPDLQIR